MVVFALTLIRHGETTHNKRQVIQGQLDVPLSIKGVEQAEILGYYLKDHQYSHIYSSDLTRALQTAQSIIRQSNTFKSTLLRDDRLRERKFGIAEGKSFKFLFDTAGKSKQNCGQQYTPPGGETIQQVHDRAVSFFKDLCSMIREQSSKLESQNASVKVNETSPNHVENGVQGGQKRKCEYNEAEKLQKIDCENGAHCKVSVKGTQDEEDCKNLACPSSNTTDEDDGSNDNNDEDNIEEHDDGNEDDEGDDDDSSAEIPTDSERSYSGALENVNEKGQFSIMFTDDIIRSQIMSSCSDLPNIECPNVSLSPLVDQNLITSSLLSNSVVHESDQSDSQERRLSVCSSCDDADSDPILIANVLVVSHGGWLRELFRYFVEDLECSVPGGKRQALRISPNAALSKFTVSLEDQSIYPKIICHQIHDKQHLSGDCYNDIFHPDEIAL